MAISELSYILDLGAGNSKPTELRPNGLETTIIGVDINSTSPDVLTMDAVNLAFPDRFFAGVQIVFPLGPLLTGLTNPSATMVDELARVMKPRAKLDIIVDQPPPAARDNLPIWRIYPQRALVNSLRRARVSAPPFSKVTTYHLAENELPDWSPTFQKMRELGSLPKIFRVRARKRG